MVIFDIESSFCLVRAENIGFMLINKRLTRQLITRKTIVCKTLNLIHFYFYLFFTFLVLKKKNPNYCHPRCRCRCSTPETAVRPGGSHPQFWRGAVAAAGWDGFLFWFFFFLRHSEKEGLDPVFC